MTVLVAAALSLVPSATADATYRDPPGDVSAAPDVIGVHVANDATNRVAFRVAFAGPQLFLEVIGVRVAIDADQDDSTGRAGMDFVLIGRSDESTAMQRWSGTRWIDMPAPSARASALADEIIVGVDRSSLGGTRSFDFAVRGVKFSANAIVASDRAPSREGDWSYTSVAKSFGIAAERLVITSPRPSVSTKVVVSLVASRTDSIEPLRGGKTTCDARVGGKGIPTFVYEREGFLTECVTARLPTWTRNKLLRLTMATTLGGKTARRSWSAKVGA